MVANSHLGKKETSHGAQVLKRQTKSYLLDLDDGSFSTSIIFLAILKYMFRILKFYYGIDIAIYAALFQNLLQPRGTRCSDTVII